MKRAALLLALAACGPAEPDLFVCRMPIVYCEGDPALCPITEPDCGPAEEEAMADAKIPTGWRKVRLEDVLHPRMLEELAQAYNRDDLTMAELRRLCAVPEYAKHMEERGLLPSFCPYWLAHHLKVQR